MQIKELTVRRAAKINIGNYENTDVDVSISVALDKEDNATEVYAVIAQNVRDLISQEVDSIELGQRRAKSKASRFGV